MAEGKKSAETGPPEAEAGSAPPSGTGRSKGASAIPPLVDNPFFSSIGKSAYDDPASDNTLYRVPFLNAAFAVSSLALLLVTVWAIWQDYDREWKQYQYEWQNQEAEQYRSQLDKEQADIKEKLAALETDLENLEGAATHDLVLEQLKGTLRGKRSGANILEVEARFIKADMDAAKYRYEEDRKHIIEEEHGAESEAARRRLGELESRFTNQWILPYERKLAEAEKAKAAADYIEADVERREAEIKKLHEQRDALVRNRDLLRANLRSVAANAQNAIRNLPLLDFFNPSAKIEKVVLPELTESLNFTDVPRVDRCKSCHINIDNPNPAMASITMENAPHLGKVFRSHPRLDLYAGSSSPHPYDKFSCAICHYGDGYSLTFRTAAHTPRNEEQAKQWEGDYHWEKMEHQAFPMLPMQYIEATCAKCHTAEARVTGAASYNLGRKMVEDYGCFGCHKIKGLEDYRKVGPNLTFIASKTSKRFLAKWIRNPTHFRPSTRMPRFFDLVNSTGEMQVIGLGSKERTHDFDRRNRIETIAITSYIYETSKRRENLRPLPPAEGTAARGKEIFTTIGCLGCHPAAQEGFTRNDHAPDLSGIGSKVNREWLADWIVNPTHHDPKTRMPRLRIEENDAGEQKLADLVAYLMSLRDQAFESAPVPLDMKDQTALAEEDRSILKDIAYDYFSRASTVTRDDAVALVESHYLDADKKPAGDPRPGDDALLRFVGEKLILRYGCFGCHEGIKGFENAQPIGTELSEHGNKLPDRLDFGQWGHQPNGEEAIAHNRIAWFTSKLKNTRIFDMIPARKVDAEGKVTYEATAKRIQKNPEELLKMPLFAFHDDPERVRALVTFLISLVNDKIPDTRKNILAPTERIIEEGQRLARFLNCQGCHRIGADIQDLSIKDLPRFSFEDPPEALARNEIEKETWLATRLKLGDLVIPENTFLSQKFKHKVLKDGEEVEDEFSVIEIAADYWKRTRKPESDQVLPVRGYREGKIRSYFGDKAEDRPKAPPLLRLEGERIVGDWLFEFILHIKPLRPWLDVRMPSYNLTQKEAAAIVGMFKGLVSAPYPHEWFDDYTLDQDLAREGKELFGGQQPGDELKNPPPSRLGCNSCHPAGATPPSNPDTSSWGPDLGLARSRLRPEWIRAWLVNPQSFMPGTKMPTFWFQFDNFNPTTLEAGDAKQLIELVPSLEKTGIAAIRPEWKSEMKALIHYLMHLVEIERQ